MRGGWLLLAGNLAAVWLTVGFLAGRQARRPRGAMLLGLAAEAVAVLAFYLVKFAAEGVPWGVATFYLFAALVTGPIAGWLGFISVHGQRAFGLFTLAGIWAAEPLGWIGLKRMRTGQVSIDHQELVLTGCQLLVGLFIALAGLKVMLNGRGSPASTAQTGLRH